MKKLKILALLGAIICAMVAFVACGKEGLSTPYGMTVDEDNRLSWTAVEDARTYVLDIKNVDNGEREEETSKKAYFSLSDLEEGDYEIRIKAISGGSSKRESKWSKVLEFHKDYESGCIYTLINNNREYELTKAGRAQGEVLLEDEYRGKPVTRIADAAFKGSGRVTSIIVGKNVETIGASAFYNCSKLTSVTLPEGLKSMGTSVFQACRVLKEVNIPEGVTTIPEYAFAYCRALEEIELSDKTVVISESAFSDCSQLKSIEIPDTVTSIGPYAFAACYTAPKTTTNGATGETVVIEEATGLTSVKIGSGVKTIDEGAFFRCGLLEEVVFAENCQVETFGDLIFSNCDALESIVIPSTVTDIGEDAFYKCVKLDNVVITGELKHIGVNAFGNTKLWEDTIKSGQPFVYADKWLVGCVDVVKLLLKTITLTELKDVEGNVIGSLKSDIVGIADKVFAGCPELNFVSLPKSLKYVGEGAFRECVKLYTVQMSDNSVVEIGDNAFRKCEFLTHVVLGQGLEKIGSYAFYKCSNLNGGEDMIPDSVIKIGTSAFKDTDLWNDTEALKENGGIVYAGNWVVGFNTQGLTTGTLKADTVGISDYAFYECTSLQSLIRLEEVKYIGRGAFYGCTSLATASLRNIKAIDEYTFYKCTSLFRIELPVRLETIGRSAFYKCEMLDALDLSKTRVNFIDKYAFYGCFNIKTLDLGENLTEISDYAFYKCTSLTELTLPDTITTIGTKAFYKCEGLVDLTLGEQVTTIGDYAFHGCSSLTKIVLPDSVKTLGRNAFYKATAVTEIDFGNGVETIGDYAFYGLENVSLLTLPESVNDIGRYAFKGWLGLKAINLRGSIEKMGQHAFYGCKNATIYVDAKEIPTLWDARWNSSYRPVIWGCEFSEDGKYVLSVKVGENTLSNAYELNVITAPESEDLFFVGWATSKDGEVVYAAKDFAEIPHGTTVYAVWSEDKTDIPEEEEEVTDSVDSADSVESAE